MGRWEEEEEEQQQQLGHQTLKLRRGLLNLKYYQFLSIAVKKKRKKEHWHWFYLMFLSNQADQKERALSCSAEMPILSQSASAPWGTKRDPVSPVLGRGNVIFFSIFLLGPLWWHNLHIGGTGSLLAHCCPISLSSGWCGKGL